MPERLDGTLASGYPQGTGAQRTGADYRQPVDASVSLGAKPQGLGFGVGGGPVSLIGAQNLAYGASRTSSTVTAPGSIAVNDLLLFVILTGANTDAPDPTPPSGFVIWPGWSPTFAHASDNFQVELRVYYKFAGGSEPGSYTATHASGSSAIWLGCYRGASLTAFAGPVSENYYQYPAQPNTMFGTATTSSVTVPISNSMVLYVMHDWGDTANDRVPPVITPTLTERLDATLLYIADGLATTQGATGNASQTTANSNNGSGWSAGLIVIQPDLAAGGITNNDSGSGTTSSSGSSTESASADDSGSGTATFSGSGTETYGTVNNDIGSGTTTTSGSGTESAAASDSRSGTSTASGTGTETSSSTDTGPGTATTSGSGTESQAQSSSQAGVATFTGSGTESYSTGGAYNDSRSGTATTSGSGTDAYSVTEARSGAATFNGTAAEGSIGDDAQSGTIITDGFGSENYVPPAVTYTDSASGLIIMLGTGATKITVLNHADAVFLGTHTVTAVHAGAVKVWP